MNQLKYKVVPQGAAEGRIPINLAYIDKKDVDAAGIYMKDACAAVAKDLNAPASVDVIDLDAVTVTSDGIMAPCAVVAFASADRGIINPEFGFIGVSEKPYSTQIVKEEPHLRQWNTEYYHGRRLYRGPYGSDMLPRWTMNETQTVTGRIANNNTGSEVMNVVDMTEILTPIFGMHQIMHDGEVLVGMSGPEVSVGIGMIVREHNGRIFGWGSVPAGDTAHASGIYAKTVKSDCWTIAATKSVHAQFVLRAINCGMVVARDISSSPVNLSIARAIGAPIDVDNITKNAWIELESIGIDRKWVESKPEKLLTQEELVAQADDILPGIVGGKKFKVSDIVEVRYAAY